MAVIPTANKKFFFDDFSAPTAASHTRQCQRDERLAKSIQDVLTDTTQVSSQGIGWAGLTNRHDLSPICRGYTSQRPRNSPNQVSAMMSRLTRFLAMKVNLNYGQDQDQLALGRSE